MFFSNVWKNAWTPLGVVQRHFNQSRLTHAARLLSTFHNAAGAATAGEDGQLWLTALVVGALPITGCSSLLPFLAR